MAGKRVQYLFSTVRAADAMGEPRGRLTSIDRVDIAWAGPQGQRSKGLERQRFRGRAGPA